MCIVSKVSEKQVLESVESLESRIKSLIEEKDRLYLQYQSLKEDNKSLESQLDNLETQNKEPKTKSKMFLNDLIKLRQAHERTGHH